MKKGYFGRPAMNAKSASRKIVAESPCYGCKRSDDGTCPRQRGRASADGVTPYELKNLRSEYAYNNRACRHRKA